MDGVILSENLQSSFAWESPSDEGGEGVKGSALVMQNSAAEGEVNGSK